MKKKILVVDKDPDVGLSIQEYLRDDYDVFFVQDGKQIIPTIQKNNIDLILTDIHIPNVYIYNLLSRIRNSFPDIPIILMYVYFDYTQEMEATLRRMADALFLKPFDLDQLKNRIKLLLAEKESSRRQLNLNT